MTDHKKDDNFRPICLLNTLSKLLERVNQSRLNRWARESNLYSTFQSGFRRHHQTADVLTRLLQQGREGLNNNKFTRVLLIDLAKAFDKIWHNGLIFTLHNKKIPNYLGKWIQNYLKDRKFQVKVCSYFSDSKNIQAGVPQGSVLGPILFIIFFNSINKRTHSGLFADDLTKWMTSR